MREGNHPGFFILMESKTKRWKTFWICLLLYVLLKSIDLCPRWGSMDFYGIFKICWSRNHLDTPAIRFHGMATEYAAYLSIDGHCWSLDSNQEGQWLIAINCLNMLREDIVQRCAVIMPAAKHALADAFLHPLPGKTNQKFHSCWLLQTVQKGAIPACASASSWSSSWHTC